MTTLVSAMLDTPAPAAGRTAPARAANAGPGSFADALDRYADALTPPAGELPAEAALLADGAAAPAPRARRAGSGDDPLATDLPAAAEAALAPWLPLVAVPAEAAPRGAGDDAPAGAVATVSPTPAGLTRSLVAAAAQQEAAGELPPQPAAALPAGADAVAGTFSIATADVAATGAPAADFADTLLEQLQWQRPRAAEAATAPPATPSIETAAQPFAAGPPPLARLGGAAAPARIEPSAAAAALPSELAPERGAEEAAAVAAATRTDAEPEAAAGEPTAAAQRTPAELPPQAIAPVVRSEAGGTGAPAAVHTGRLAPPVGSGEWAPALAQHLVQLDAGRGRQVQLHLNPADLGPLQVTVSVSDQSAQLLFVSEHAAVRQAVEAALPQLRASFAEQGISLGQASVDAGSGEAAARQAAGGDERPRGQAPRGERTPAPATPVGAAAPGRPVPAGSLDTFA